MSQTFDSYETDFRDQMRTYTSLTERFNGKSDDEEKLKMIEDMRNLLTAAEKKYKGMENEASFLKKDAINSKLRLYWSNYDQNQKNFMSLEREFLDKMNRRKLLDQKDKSTAVGVRQDLKGRYIQTNEKAYQQTEIMKDVASDLEQAITITVNTNEVLYDGRNKLESVNETNKNVNRQIDLAQKTAENMYTRETCNRILLWIGVIVLFFTDVFILIYKITKNN